MGLASAIHNLLKNIVGETQEDIWLETAGELGAKYVSGGAWQSDKILLNHRNRTIVLDMSAVTKGKAGAIYARFTLMFKNLNGFWFSVNNESVLDKIIATGDPRIDRIFAIEGQNEKSVSEFFKDEKIIVAIKQLKYADFGIKNKESFYGPVFPDETTSLQFLSDSIIKDKEEIKKVFELFKCSIDKLTDMGVMADLTNEIVSSPNL